MYTYISILKLRSCKKLLNNSMVID